MAYKCKITFTMSPEYQNPSRRKSKVEEMKIQSRRKSKVEEIKSKVEENQNTK